MPPLVSPLAIVSSASPQPIITEVSPTQWNQNLSEMDPSMESALAIVPSPTLKKVKEKRKDQQVGCPAFGGVVHFGYRSFNYIQPYVHLLRQKALALKETPPLPPSVKVEIDHLKTELIQAKQDVTQAREQMMKGVESPLSEEQPAGPLLAELVTLHKQLAMKRATLEEGYEELSKIADTNQRASKENILRQQYREITSFEFQVSIRREALFNEQLRSAQLTQHATILANMVETALVDTLQFIGSEGQDIGQIVLQTSSLISLVQRMSEI
eukprot:Gb_28338 [translate_table: standard]